MQQDQRHTNADQAMDTKELCCTIPFTETHQTYNTTYDTYVMYVYFLERKKKIFATEQFRGLVSFSFFFSSSISPRSVSSVMQWYAKIVNYSYATLNIFLLLSSLHFPSMQHTLSAHIYMQAVRFITKSATLIGSKCTEYEK